MSESIMMLVVSIIAFCLGCIMAYWILSDREKWDSFWERQNRGRPLTPSSWAGSGMSKAVTYVLATLFLLGGLAGICRSLHIY